jgi:DNA-binding NtrC family response regulator
MAKLLVIDDEPNIVYSIEQCLGSPTLEIISAGTGRMGVERAKACRPDAVLLDVRLPDGNGLEIFEELRAFDRLLPVVLMTAYASSETAIAAISHGAFDYVLKPVDLPTLRRVVERALESSRINRTPVVLAEDPTAPQVSDLIIGRSVAMQEVYKLIGRIAAQDEPVLILGESGVGKELVARAIYHYSARRQLPFLAINCAALPESLLESELFGHEKGAFTGADHRRIGKFEQVNGGTIFLDEIGDMTGGTQAKALRVLQDQCFERVGGNTSVRTNVRVIAATNQDLPRRVQEGKFRLDLYYRLNGFTIHIPPLRERREDIVLLVEHFLRRANREFRRNVSGFTPTALEALQRHDWPGNIRELQSAVRYAVIQSTTDVIAFDSLPLSCRRTPSHAVDSSSSPPLSPTAPSPVISHSPPTPNASPPTASPIQFPSPFGDAGSSTAGESVDLRELAGNLLRESPGDAYRRLLHEFDSQILPIAWEHSRGNQAYMAELLGVSRMTLRAKLRAIGLLPERTQTEERPE